MTEVEGITVNGYGSAGAAPDVVRLSLAAEASDISVQQAIDRAATGLSAMRQALLDRGLAERDLVSAEASAYTDGSTRTRHIARFGLTATVREVTRAGELLSAALAAAGDAGRMNGLSFAHSDPSALFAEAQSKAMADARARAVRLAGLAERQLGPVVQVVEGGARPPVPVRDVQRMAMAMESVAISPGELDVSAVVTVRYGWA